MTKRLILLLWFCVCGSALAENVVLGYTGTSTGTWTRTVVDANNIVHSWSADDGPSGWDNTNNPTMELHMENDRGTVADESLSGNDAIIVGWTAYDYTDKAILLASDYIGIPDNDNLSPATGVIGTDSGFTIVMWIKVADMTSQKFITSWDITRDWEVATPVDDTIYVSFWDVSGNRIGQVTDSALTCLENDWFQLAVTKDASLNASGIKIYTNGAVCVSTIIDVGGYTGSTNRGNTVNIGAETLGVDSFMNGYVSQPRIYKRQLSDVEIATLFSTGRTNEVIATVNTNNLSWYASLLLDPQVRDTGSGGNSGTIFGSQASGSWNITGTNVDLIPGQVEHGEYMSAIANYIRYQTDNGFAPMTNAWALHFWLARGEDDDTEMLFTKAANDGAIADMLTYFSSSGVGEMRAIVYQQGNTASYIARSAPDYNIANGDTWVYIDYNGGTNDTDLRIFYDNVQVDDTSFGSGLGTFTNASFNAYPATTIKIGRRWISGEYLKGTLDVVTFYAGRILSPQARTNVFFYTGYTNEVPANYRNQIR